MTISNYFAAGEIASGDKFIGRTTEIDRLSNIFKSTASLHLVGATRIGKSSLVEKVFNDHFNDEGILEIRLDLSVYENAFQFWFSLCEEIADVIESKEIESPVIEKHKHALLSMEETDSSWYAKMRRPLTKTLQELKKNGYRAVVALDEFDAVTRVFEGNAAYYQMLRSLFSEGKYGFNGVIVSRRNLEVLEAKTEDVSTFHGVFDTLRLKAFSEAEMEDFFLRLENAGVVLDDGGKEQYFYYTGGIPYLCCMLGNQLLNVFGDTDHFEAGADEVVEAHKVCQPAIWRYYNDLVARLEEDGHLEPLVYLAFDEMRTLSYAHNRDNMIAMGYLNETTERDGTPSYYAYSRGFMYYLRMKPLDMDTWSLLSASEKKLKCIFGMVYPKFSEVTLRDIEGPDAEHAKTIISEAHRETGFRWDSTTEKFLKSARAYLENPSVLDTIAITFGRFCTLGR